MLLGCRSDNDIEESIGTHTRKMVFAGTLQRFDPDTRAASVAFHSGDIMYLKLGNVITAATYNGSDWIVAIPEDFPDVSSGSCVAYYIEGDSKSESLVNLTSSSIVYTGTGSYSNTLDALVINATVSPVTSRIRFRGVSGTKITVSGLQVLTSFDATSFVKKTSSEPIDLTVTSDGFTPYVYSSLTSSRELNITYDTESYTRQLPSTAMQIGHSGFIDIPSNTNHAGWNYEEQPNADVSGEDYGNDEDWNKGTQEDDNSENKTFAVNGITFTMVAVEGGTFTMGGTDAYADEKPAHQVTLSSYYIGETEVTQELWQAVMNYKPTNGGYQWSSTYGLNAQCPAYYISWNDIQEFITKLNALTGKTFRMPTEAEWEYAARGGKNSKSYKYCGSNSLVEVAWYLDNSDYSHTIKTKSPNELGIYDMTGNVWEWCYDWYGSYSSTAQTNPTGPSSGTTRIRRGGSWDAPSSYCRISQRLNLSPTTRQRDVGFRLVLSETSSSEDRYVRYDYITGVEGKPTGSINTGVYINQDYIVEEEFMIKSWSNGWLFISNTGNDQSTDFECFLASGYQNTLFFDYYGGRRMNKNLSLNVKYKFKFQHAGGIFDETNNKILYSPGTKTNFTRDVELCLLAPDTKRTITSVQIGHTKIYEGATLLRDLYPCKYENKIGMYDKANDKFYPLSGEGEAGNW